MLLEGHVILSAQLCYDLSNAIQRMIERIVKALQFEVPSYVDCGTIWRHAICMRDAQRQAVTCSADG